MITYLYILLCTMYGRFPIKIGTQISLLIAYSLAICILRYKIKIAKLYVISKLIWDSISIGNPPVAFIHVSTLFCNSLNKGVLHLLAI